MSVDPWVLYAHLANPLTPNLNPLTPAHIRGVYEIGRWARANRVLIKHCPYARYSEFFQEWCVGWLAEDEEIIASTPFLDTDFEPYEQNASCQETTPVV